MTFTLWTQTISFCSTTNEFFTRVHRHSQEHKRTEITSPYGNLLLDKALLFCRKSVSYLIDISSTHREYTPKYLRRNFIAQEILNQPKVNTIFITFFLLYFSNAPSFFFDFSFFSVERQCFLCILLQRMEIGKYSKFLWMFESQKVLRWRKKRKWTVNDLSKVKGNYGNIHGSLADYSMFFSLIKCPLNISLIIKYIIAISLYYFSDKMAVLNVLKWTMIIRERK